MATSQPVTFPLPYDTVFGTFLQVLPNLKLTVTSYDQAQGIIRASSGVSFSSWGENITIQMGASAPDTTTATITSDLKFGLVAWGKHEKNFARIFDAVQQQLHTNTQPWSGQPPAGGGPPA
jgi:hypothetical protein